MNRATNIYDVKWGYKTQSLTHRITLRAKFVNIVKISIFNESMNRDQAVANELLKIDVLRLYGE